MAINGVSVNKVIGEGIMILESIVLILPGVLVLPYPGQLLLACRNQQPTIGRNDIHGLVRIFQTEQVVVHVIHGSVKCLVTTNFLGGHVVVHHVSGNMFLPVPPILYKTRGKHTNLT